jgi:two-component system chemotaxis response regulator CheY
MEPLNILVVDDSLLTVKKLVTMLEEAGHKVVRTAATGKEAIAAYSECNPDLVTMDITMPDMDGIEAAKTIISTYPDALIIMVTSHRQKTLVLDALKAGAKNYIIKPYEKDKLLAVIKQTAASYMK